MAEQKRPLLFWIVFFVLLLGTGALLFGHIIRPRNPVHFFVAPLFFWMGLAQLLGFFPTLGGTARLSPGSQTLMGISFVLLSVLELTAAFDLWLFSIPLCGLELVLLLWIWQRER